MASRAAQAATLKAEKAGDKTVDLEAAKKKGNSSSEKDDSSSQKSVGDGGDTPIL